MLPHVVFVCLHSAFPPLHFASSILPVREAAGPLVLRTGPPQRPSFPLIARMRFPACRSLPCVPQVDPVFEGLSGGPGSLVKYNPLTNITSAEVWNFLRVMVSTFSAYFVAYLIICQSSNCHTAVPTHPGMKLLRLPRSAWHEACLVYPATLPRFAWHPTASSAGQSQQRTHSRRCAAFTSPLLLHGLLLGSTAAALLGPSLCRVCP